MRAVIEIAKKWKFCFNDTFEIYNYQMIIIIYTINLKKIITFFLQTEYIIDDIIFRDIYSLQTKNIKTFNLIDLWINEKTFPIIKNDRFRNNK